MSRFIAKTATGTFVLRIFYLGSGFFTTLLLTNWLGADGLGAYNFVISWVLLAAIFVKFGFEDYLVRETAAARGRGDSLLAQQLWRFSRRFILLGSTFAVAVFLTLLGWVRFEDKSLNGAFWVGVMMIPMLSLIALYRGRFRANKQVLNSQIPEYLIRPLLLLVCVGGLFWTAVPGRPEFALLVNVLVTLVALAYCMLMAKHDGLETAQDTGDSKNSVVPGPDLNLAGQWVLGAFPFVVIAGISIINQRTDRLMLGALRDMKSVGYYSVAVQMAMVVNFTLIGLNQAIAPLVAERHDSNRSQELQQSLIRATNVATLGSLAIVATLIVLGPIVLDIFGAEFSASYLPMIILAVGQLLNVAAGPVGILLSMSRRERFVGIGMGISVVCNVLLNYLLIPRLGVDGAAIATAVSVGVWNLLMVIFAKRILGINSNLIATLIPTFPPKQ